MKMHTVGMNVLLNLMKIEDSIVGPSGDVGSIVVDGKLSEGYETEELDSVGSESDDGDKHKFIGEHFKSNRSW
ncbi:hypothetical protein JHK86_001607 [Glycine max]|nr:hypothetical protein JHK86_001607 [Glycine max]